MVTMKGILCTIILKIHDPPPPQSLSLYAAIRAAPLAGAANTVMRPNRMTAAAWRTYPKRSGTVSGRQTLCLPVVYDRI